MRDKKRHALPPFIALPYDLLNSLAYCQLPFAAAKALPYFFAKVKKPYSDPNRYCIEFSLSYREGKRYGFASGTFARVVRDLVKFGFVDPVDKGGLRSDGKSCNLFRLSRRWEDFGRSNFHEIDWSCFLPRLRYKTTLKYESDRFKKGNTLASCSATFSESDAVGALQG